MHTWITLQAETVTQRSYIMRKTALILAITSSIALSGCGYLSSFVYKADIPQGNFVEAKQVKKLRVGMSKEQVRFVIGTPMITNSFSEDNWYYIYRLKRGNGDLITKRLVAHFDGDKLVSVTGDYEISEEFDTPLDI